MSCKAFQLPGVCASDFRRASNLHGEGHVNRVICLGQLLLRRIDDAEGFDARWTKRFAAPLWAACYLHDLARRHDGFCLNHGQWAVDERLPELTPFFLSRGVDKEQIPMIAAAVRWHSLPDDPPRESKEWALTALLKDVDALDRVRLGSEGRLNPRFLRFKASDGFIPVAEALYRKTATNPDLTVGPDLNSL